MKICLNVLKMRKVNNKFFNIYTHKIIVVVNNMKLNKFIGKR